MTITDLLAVIRKENDDCWGPKHCTRSRECFACLVAHLCNRAEVIDKENGDLRYLVTTMTAQATRALKQTETIQ